MTERKSSAADAALRERLTELCVHIPCGRLRGPVRLEPRWHLNPRVRWQSCWDEDSPEVWADCDASEDRDLCVICFRGTAGGPSRWAWLACEDCRAINNALETTWGFRPLALGRHSLMNDIGVRGGASPETQKSMIARLSQFAKGNGRLGEWRSLEYPRLASRFDPLVDIPVRVWQQEWAPGRQASADAFSQLLGVELPLQFNE